MIPSCLLARLPQDDLARGRALSIVEASFAQVMTSLTSGAALAGFALLLGATPLHIGLMASLPALAALAQLSAPYWTQRFGSRRTLVVRALSLSRTQWILLAALPLLPLAAAAKPGALLVIMTAAGALSAVGSTAWLSWMGDIVPRAIRGRYFANRNLVLGGIALLLGPLVGAYLDLPLWRSESGERGLTGFMTLLAAGTVVGWLSLLVLRRVIEPPIPEAGQRMRLRQEMRLPWQHRDVRGYIVYRAAWALAVGICGNFFTVYLIQQLGLSYSLIYVLGTLSTLTQLVSLRYWGRLSDRLGAKKIIIMTSLGKGIFALSFAFTSAANLPLLVFVHLLGTFEGGLNLSVNSMLLNIVPPKNSTAYIGTYSAVVNVFSAISPMIGGLLVASAQGLHLELGGVLFDNYQVLFLISGVARLATVALTGLFDEQEMASIAAEPPLEEGATG